jgi:hypothetical protein
VRDGGINAGGDASVDDHRGAFTGEGGGDLFANATGRGGDEGQFIVEVEIHDGLFLLKDGHSVSGTGSA